MTLTEARPAAPTSSEDSRTTRLTLALVRIVVAFMWIENVGWKRPPDFNSLHAYTEDAVTHPVWHPYAVIVQHVILPNFTFFAWVTLLLEATIGAFLLVGLLTRLFALIGLGQAVVITLSALNAPGEWEWSYYLMMVAHLALFATAAGRMYGVDALLRPRWLSSRTTAAHVLARCS